MRNNEGFSHCLEACDTNVAIVSGMFRIEIFRSSSSRTADRLGSSCEEIAGVNEDRKPLHNMPLSEFGNKLRPLSGPHIGRASQISRADHGDNSRITESRASFNGVQVNLHRQFAKGDGGDER